MLTAAFLLLYCTTPIVIVFLLKISEERPREITLITVVIYSIYIFSVVGTFPLFFMLDEYRVAIGVIKQDVVLYVLAYSVLASVFLLIGVIFVRKILRLKVSKIKYCADNNINADKRIKLTITLIILFYILEMYLEKFDSTAISLAISNSIADAAIARSDMGNNLDGGGAHWYKLLLNYIGGLVTYSFFATWLMNKNKFSLIMFMTSFIFSTFVAVMAIEKAPFINLMISMAMVYLIIRNNGVIPIKKFMLFGFIIFATLVYFYIAFMGVNSILEAFTGVLSRAFSGSIAPAYFYVELFPDQKDYLLGKTFPNPGGLMPYTTMNYTVEMMDWVFPGAMQNGVVGSMPTVFWGEAYINFGWIGILIISFIVGIVLSILTYILQFMPKNPITIGLNVTLIDHYRQLSSTGFSSYIFDIYFWCVIAFAAALLISTSANVRKQPRFIDC